MQDISLWDQQLQGVLTIEGPFVSLFLNTEVTSQDSPHDSEYPLQLLIPKTYVLHVSP